MQLLYEFNKVCGDPEDIVITMESNWNKVCLKLLPDCDELTLSGQRQVLQMVEKNIYHKKPSMLPITLAMVSIAIMYSIVLMSFIH